MIQIYSPEQMAIKPFIFAPIPELQDTIILGCQELALPDFKQRLYSKVGNNAISTFHLCVFYYKELPNDHVISMSFPSMIPEEGSNRLGQVLTIGAAFDKNLFTLNAHASSFCLYLLEAFNNIFELDIYQNGADEFILSLSDESKTANVEQKIKTFFLTTTNLLHLLPQKEIVNKNLKSWLPLGLLEARNRPIQIILCRKNENIKSHIEIILFFINDALNNARQKNLDVFFSGIKTDCHVQIIQCLPEDLQINTDQASVQFINGKPIIAIR